MSVLDKAITGFAYLMVSVLAGAGATWLMLEINGPCVRREFLCEEGVRQCIRTMACYQYSPLNFGAADWLAMLATAAIAVAVTRVIVRKLQRTSG